MIKDSFRNICIIFFLSSVISYSIAFAEADTIFKENSKTVVIILTYDEKGELIAQGSGFIVRSDGAIVTNYHCISKAKDIKIKSGDKILDVEGLIYTDKENDLVILKAKGGNLSVVKLGDIEKTNVGEKVYVISSPQGFENTISDGILSGIREITPERKILQITAPVSPGSSGGPVFNKNGEVIGIATFVVKEAQNLNFAMPVNFIRDKINIEKVTALKESEIEDYKKTAEYWFVLGFYLGGAGLNKEAIDAFKQAISIKPDFAEAYYNLGVAYGKLDMYKESIEVNKQAIRIIPDYVEAHMNLGFAYGKLGMYKEDIETCKQAIRIKPDYAEAYYSLGVVYGKSGMYKESIEACNQAIKIKSDFADAYYCIGVTYDRLGMYREAVDAFRQVIILRPDTAAETYSVISNIYYECGMYKDSIECCKRAIRINPDYAKAHYGLGATYLEVGEKGMALEEYKILKDLDPQLAKDLFNLIYE